MEYSYDNASQLTGLTYKLGSTTLGNLTYTYNLVGQRTSVGGAWARTDLPNALASATYDAANQIATFGNVAFTYDANGNLTSDGTKTYTWNARNELSGLSGGVSASFQYDGFGRRGSKTVSGASTGFLYDGLNPVQEFVAGSTSASILTGLEIDEWLTRTDSAGARHFLTDVLGSTVALSDASGAVQTQYTYEPFGKATSSGAASTNGFQFTGREDDGTGLLYYRARFYNSNAQRFVAEDPIGFAGGLNLYRYVSNDPIDNVDPYGLHAKKSGKHKIAHKMETQLPDGRVVNLRTPIGEVNGAISDAAKKGWSKNVLNTLKQIRKVVRRGGRVGGGLALMLLDPDPIIAAECPFGPGTCVPVECPSGPGSCVPEPPPGPLDDGTPPDTPALPLAGRSSH